MYESRNNCGSNTIFNVTTLMGKTDRKTHGHSNDYSPFGPERPWVNDTPKAENFLLKTNQS